MLLITYVRSCWCHGFVSVAMSFIRLSKCRVECYELHQIVKVREKFKNNFCERHLGEDEEGAIKNSSQEQWEDDETAKKTPLTDINIMLTTLIVSQ